MHNNDDWTWVKLYRRILKSRVFRNEGLLKVWLWCLIKMEFTKTWVTIKIGKVFTEVEVGPGQFVFGRKSAAKELRMPESTIWKRMQKLENMRNLNIDSNSHYSIITIINWERYQGVIEKRNSKGNSRGTAGEQPIPYIKNYKNNARAREYFNIKENDPRINRLGGLYYHFPECQHCGANGSNIIKGEMCPYCDHIA